ncbi:hypothetical protein EB74_08635 [Mycobacterium sp. SWH-M5]|nr:hypothetical protein EB74_08635 [Mycobacterium sp. SWH-M5]
MTMTTCATSEDRPVRRGSRLPTYIAGSLHSDRLEQWQELTNRYGPAECKINSEVFDQAERAVELLTAIGLQPDVPMIVIDDQAIDIAEPITTVQQWCQRCPFAQLCYDDMTLPVRYTGIAGGRILHKGRDYQPRKGRVKGRPKTTKQPDNQLSFGDTESGETDGLW